MPATLRDRSAARKQYRGTDEHRLAFAPPLEFREVPNGTGGTNLRLSAFASVTGDAVAYEMEDWLGPWVESITPGAFRKTLSENPDVVFRLNHEGLPLGRTKAGTLTLREFVEPASSPIPGVTGLHYDVQLDPRNSLVEQIRSAVERGDLSQSSFAFRVTRERWDESTWERRWIDEVSLDRGDVSICTYGANPSTDNTVSLRQRPPGRPGRRADGDPSCNRCHGDGTVTIPCPLCGKSATGDEAKSHVPLSSNGSSISRERLRIERERGKR